MQNHKASPNSFSGRVRLQRGSADVIAVSAAPIADCCLHVLLTTMRLRTITNLIVVTVTIVLANVSLCYGSG